MLTSHFTVGAVTIIPLSDGDFALPATRVFSSTREEDWSPYREFLTADGQLPLNIGAFLLNEAGEWTLVDTGYGGRGGPGGKLPGEIEKVGVRPEQIRRVIITHLHSDHIGWNTVDRDGRAEVLFKNARHILQRREWEYYTQPDVLAQNPAVETCVKPVEAAGLLELIDGDAVITTSVSALLTPGHTPGHQSLLINSGNEKAIITGDVTHTPVQIAQPEWSPTFDHDPEESARTRLALFARIEQEGLRVCAGHYRYPSIGNIVRVEGKRVWTWL